MTIKYGLIGCGMMGQEHLKNIALLGDVDVKAIYDPRADLAAAGRKYAPDAEVKDSIAAVLDAGVDAVVVSSPNDLHVPQLLEIMAHRPVPVLLEKPAYVNAEQAALLGDMPAPVWVAMEYRYMPPIAAFLDQVEQVTGGIEMLTIREHRFPFLPKVDEWNQQNVRTGGTMVEKCCHFFDLMRHALGAEPVRVMASGGQAVNHLGKADVWDHGYVIVDFEGGKKAMLELSMFAEGSRYQEELSAVGSRGKLEAFVPGPGRFWNAKQGPAPVPQVVISPRYPVGPVVEEVPVDPVLLDAGDHNGATFYQHQKFLDVVRGNAMPEVTLTDGMKAVQIGLAAQEAGATGQVVVL